ncbi:phosphatidylethanolamine-binding protein [Jimgerdemannia flammicorona]|uniref:Phosphatidylethanolamine-binding protein n=1 Tax=Jimgerdemannia flammicorona TaxID=994334 RepID=A0A433A0Y7_9FUNG|nr:phosphatidylethanolamine-binding protein [Jimgerdemannia flammicorona]
MNRLRTLASHLSPFPATHLSIRTIPTFYKHLSNTTANRTTVMENVVPSLKAAEIIPDETQKPPEIDFKAEEGEVKYCVIMTDPDAPSRQSPIRREWRHWVVGNIPGTNIAEGDELEPYMGPAPPQDSGPHRYVFLLYRQTGVRMGFAPFEHGHRAGFKAATWAEQHEMKLVGANYFLVERNPIMPCSDSMVEFRRYDEFYVHVDNLSIVRTTSKGNTLEGRPVGDIIKLHEPSHHDHANRIKYNKAPLTTIFRTTHIRLESLR